MPIGDADDGIFFRDGSVAALDNGTTAGCHLDHVESEGDFASARTGMVSGPPQMTYATAALPNLKHDDKVTIDGVAYKVRGAPRKQSDGRVSVADLAKV